LGQEKPLEKGMATHSNFLTWRIPWIEDEWIYKKKHTNMLPTRDSLQIHRHTETESEGMEKGIPCK